MVEKRKTTKRKPRSDLPKIKRKILQHYDFRGGNKGHSVDETFENHPWDTAERRPEIDYDSMGNGELFKEALKDGFGKKRTHLYYQSPRRRPVYGPKRPEDVGETRTTQDVKREAKRGPTLDKEIQRLLERARGGDEEAMEILSRDSRGRSILREGLIENPDYLTSDANRVAREYYNRGILESLTVEEIARRNEECSDAYLACDVDGLAEIERFDLIFDIVLYRGIQDGDVLNRCFEIIERLDEKERANYSFDATNRRTLIYKEFATGELYEHSPIGVKIAAMDGFCGQVPDLDLTAQIAINNAQPEIKGRAWRILEKIEAAGREIYLKFARLLKVERKVEKRRAVKRKRGKADQEYRNRAIDAIRRYVAGQNAEGKIYAEICGVKLSLGPDIKRSGKIERLDRLETAERLELVCDVMVESSDVGLSALRILITKEMPLGQAVYESQERRLDRLMMVATGRIYPQSHVMVKVAALDMLEEERAFDRIAQIVVASGLIEEVSPRARGILEDNGVSHLVEELRNPKPKAEGLDDKVLVLEDVGGTVTAYFGEQVVEESEPASEVGLTQDPAELEELVRDRNGNIEARKASLRTLALEFDRWDLVEALMRPDTEIGVFAEDLFAEKP